MLMKRCVIKTPGIITGGLNYFIALYASEAFRAVPQALH